MTHGLDDPPDGALDFVSLGALVHRLDPGHRAVPQGDRVRRFT